MNTDIRKTIVAELVELINIGNAHVSFEKAVANLPESLRTVVPEGLPYSIWQLVEHMRITQKDILTFSLSADYVEINWPDDYWTPNKEKVEDDEWENSLKSIKEDRESFFKLLRDDKKDLFEAFEWGTGQSLFREAVLIGDHNSYHTAEIVVIRRILNSWK